MARNSKRTPASSPQEVMVGRAARALLPTCRRKKATGLGAACVVAHHTAEGWKLTAAVADGTGPPEDRIPTSDLASAAKRLRRKTDAHRLGQVLAALGNPHRLKLALKVLEGPATYQALRKASRLQAGPLYHHITQLRLAGVLAPKERDLYRLTRGGRNVLLAVITLPGLLADKRPCTD